MLFSFTSLYLHQTVLFSCRVCSAATNWREIDSRVEGRWREMLSFACLLSLCLPLPSSTAAFRNSQMEGLRKREQKLLLCSNCHFHSLPSHSFSPLFIFRFSHLTAAFSRSSLWTPHLFPCLSKSYQQGLRVQRPHTCWSCNRERWDLGIKACCSHLIFSIQHSYDGNGS